MIAVSSATLRAATRDWTMHNWSTDPYSHGVYTYARTGHGDAGSKLRESIEDTLFFAGEATADGAEQDTVHGALTSGLRAADKAAAALRRA